MKGKQRAQPIIVCTRHSQHIQVTCSLHMLLKHKHARYDLTDSNMQTFGRFSSDKRSATLLTNEVGVISQGEQ